MKNIPIHELSQIKQKLTKYKDDFVWLSPPEHLTHINVSDVLSANNPEEHRKIVYDWAKYIFDGWSEHHAVAQKLLDKIT